MRGRLLPLSSVVYGWRFSLRISSVQKPGVYGWWTSLSISPVQIRVGVRLLFPFSYPIRTKYRRCTVSGGILSALSVQTLCVVRTRLRRFDANRIYYLCCTVIDCSTPISAVYAMDNGLYGAHFCSRGQKEPLLHRISSILQELFAVLIFVHFQHFVVNRHKFRIVHHAD